MAAALLALGGEALGAQAATVGAEAAGAAAESAAGAEAAGGFTMDSAINFLKMGGKLVGDAFSLATSIMHLMKTEDLKNEMRSDAKMKRYNLGLLLPGEDRNQLVFMWQVPVYYSDSNIKSLLKSGVLPYAWTKSTAIAQGYSKEIHDRERLIEKGDAVEELAKHFKDKINMKELNFRTNELKYQKMGEEAIKRMNIV